MSERIYFRLLLCAVLAFAGGAAQLHALAHAQHDLATAGQGANARAPLDNAFTPLEKSPAPLKHSTDQCLVVHTLDSAGAETGLVLAVERDSHDVLLPLAERGGESPARAFQPRAPPVFG